MEFLWFLLIGLAAGWLAGQVMKGGGFGVVGDLVIGVIGELRAVGSSACWAYSPGAACSAASLSPSPDPVLVLVAVDQERRRNKVNIELVPLTIDAYDRVVALWNRRGRRA